MTPITRDEIEELERKAKAATPGEWHAAPWNTQPNGYLYGPAPIRGVVPDNPNLCQAIPPSSFTAEDADYIAAAHPETMLRLIARIRELEAMLIRVNGRLEEAERKYYLESDRREELEAALRPFADVATDPGIDQCAEDDALCVKRGDRNTTGATVGCRRIAAAVLAKGEE